MIGAADADVLVSNPDCGDTVRLTLRIDQGVIQEARFKAFGCGAAIAAASRLTEMLTNLSLAEARAVRDESVAAALGGLPEEKIRCSVLAEEAVSAALIQYASRAGQVPDED